MVRTVVVRGHVVGATTVELEEPVPGAATDVQVILRVVDEALGRPDRISDFLGSLPPGTRSKEGIDRQIDEDRGSWDR